MRALVATMLVATVSLTNADTVENQALGHLDRGVAAYRLGDYAEARIQLGLAIDLAPDRPNAYRWRALTEAAQHDCGNAVVDAESFLSRVATDDARVPEVQGVRDRCVSAARTEPLASPVTRVAEQTPIYHQWWLWVAIGVATVAAVGLTVAVTRDREATLPTVHCTATGCAP